MMGFNGAGGFVRFGGGGGGGGGGTVTGTGTDNHITRWDGTGVPVIQDSGVIITDAGNLIPAANDTQDLGESTTPLRWRDLYLGSKIDYASILTFERDGTKAARFTAADNMLIGTTADSTGRRLQVEKVTTDTSVSPSAFEAVTTMNGLLGAVVAVTGQILTTSTGVVSTTDVTSLTGASISTNHLSVATATVIQGININTADAGAGSHSLIFGANLTTSNSNDAQAASTMYGIQNNLSYSSTAAATIMRGEYILLNNTSTGSITDVEGVNVTLQNTGATATITNASGIKIHNWFNPTGTVTNTRAIWITNSVGVGTTNHAMYSESTDASYFEGAVGVGLSGPTAKVEVVGAFATSATFGLKVHDSTGTSNTLIVRDDGRVGIGTSTPLRLLSLNQTGASTAMDFQKSGVEKATVGTDNTFQYFVSTPAIYQLAMNTSFEWKMGANVDNSGYKFLVAKSTVGDASVLQLYNVATATNDNSSMLGFSQNQISGVANPVITSSITGIMTDISSGSVDGDLIFSTMAASVAPTEKMRILSSGEVGIGTSSPRPLLEVGVVAESGANVFNSASINTIGVGGNTNGQLYAEGTGMALVTLDDSGAAANNHYFQMVMGSGKASFRFPNDAGSIRIADLITMDVATGNVGISVASAASGLDIQSSLGLQRTATAVSASALGETIVGVTDNSSQRTITLDTDDVVDGRVLIIKDEAGTAGSANNIIIATEGAETIDGAATINITVDYGVLRVYSDGTNWFTF